MEYSHLANTYHYDRLHKMVPKLTKIRAGVVVLRKVGNTTQMLLVHTRVGSDWSKSRVYGPPKGMAEPYDASAFDTALRELREETSIDLPRVRAVIAPSVIAVTAPHHGGTEIIVYFVALLLDHVDVRVDQHEIEGYSWIDLSYGANMYSDVFAMLTKQLMRTIEQTNLLYTDTTAWIPTPAA